MAYQDKAAIVTKAHVASSASHTLVSSKPCMSVPDYSPDLGVPTAQASPVVSRLGGLRQER